mmetsp:Transcript_21798/g.45819  ORF Transcript_21798/g.45819 Transcript_21798/m.45819 type:complete len:146 (+) Transcript_21798:187-624(+)|eukprot:CAMPEP_0172202558 /NCGR_PEP_ID=MMETSP1050-20130122/30733_1 /TAXON_ID=233186 /ORGANISM="Cryptomonas curvata, Strain CCAP979/52" /LENGTH=145 /DNA_ID=CAMNT_0012880551 /DNA_START=124 /DNA_END=561 /DNA_ORIENTATION=-
MADSGQQPTADTDTLVNKIFEYLTQMDIKQMDVSCERVFFQTLLRDLPTLSPEIKAGRLQKFSATLRRKYRMLEDAANIAAAEPDGSTKSIAIGRKASPATPASPATHTHGGCNQISDGAGADTEDVQKGGAATPAGNFPMRAET